ncbi:MAG: hypothetical protein ACLR6B_15585 [Blautia sp.]
MGQTFVQKDETIRENKKNQVKAIREEVKTEIKALQEEYFAETPETEFKDMQAAGRPMKVLVELTLAFIKVFTEEKRYGISVISTIWSIWRFPFWWMRKESLRIRQRAFWPFPGDHDR